MQAVGDSRHPLYYLIFSSLLNVILDMVFVGALGFGVAGAALATIIAQFASAALVPVSTDEKKSGGIYSFPWENMLGSGICSKQDRVQRSSGWSAELCDCSLPMWWYSPISTALESWQWRAAVLIPRSRALVFCLSPVFPWG